MHYISDMKKWDINYMLAKNLEAAMKRKFDGEVNQSELARLSGVSQKTISNILSALVATPGEKGHSTTLSKIEPIAKALGVELWELVHPDPDKARREQEFYKRIEEDFTKLPPVEERRKAQISSGFTEKRKINK